MVKHKNMMKLTKIECFDNQNGTLLFANIKCSIKAIGRYRSAINIDADFLKSFDDVIVNMQVYKKNSVRYLPFLVNMTINICKFLNGTAKTSFYASLMVDWINKYSNINHSCPYSGHIFIRNMEPFPTKLPFAPAGYYRLDLAFYQSVVTDWIGTVRGYGTVTYRPFIQQDNF